MDKASVKDEFENTTFLRELGLRQCDRYRCFQNLIDVQFMLRLSLGASTSYSQGIYFNNYTKIPGTPRIFPMPGALPSHTAACALTNV
jgi:hypothetical protein